MAPNIFAALLIICIYLPIIVYKFLSKDWQNRFMKVHAKTKQQHLNELIAGTLYASIIVFATFEPFTTNQTLFLVGTCVYFIGLIITYSGYYTFFNAPKNKVIKQWPFSISRNPTYFFGFIAIVGVALITKNNLLILLVLAQFMVTHNIILLEEAYCIQTYKKEYERYCKKVRRYL